MWGWYLTLPPCQAGSHSSPAEQEENRAELGLCPSWSRSAGPTSKHHIPGTSSAPQQCPCFQGLARHDIASSCVCQPCKNLFPHFRVELGPKICFLILASQGPQHHCNDSHGLGSLVELLRKHLLSLGMLRELCPALTSQGVPDYDPTGKNTEGQPASTCSPHL